MKKKQNNNTQKLFKNVAIAFLLFISILLIFSSAYAPKETIKNISLNELANSINAQDVTKITVKGNVVSIEFKDGTKGTTQKEAESGLSQTLANYNVDAKKLSTIPLEVKDESGFQFWMSVLLPTLIPVIIIGFFFWFTFRQAKSGASQAFTFGKSNIKLFAPFKDRVTFADVAGLKEAKQELLEVVDFLKNPKKYLDLGATIPRGVLLLGQPGTGKTLLARAVAGEAGVPFFHISASEFVEMFVGVGASRTRDAFAVAKKAAPSILFVDEIDAVGRERGAGVGGGHDEREQTLNQILVEMDGFEKDTQVIVLAATNRPDILDAALLRPGRFDRRVTLDLPDINDREAILKIHSRNKTFTKDVDLRQIAIRTPGFSGADLANLMNEAAILAARENKKEVGQQHLYESIEKVLLGPERRSRSLSKHEKKVTAYHEAGHALISSALKDADPVHKVSIVARGQAGGYTLKLPLEEKYLRTKKQFIAELAVSFGGYAAEELLFKDISTGASNDLAVASETARKMVTRYGMSEKLGPITFGKTQELVFLGKEIATEKNYSETTALEIDREVERIIKEAHENAKRVLVKNKKALDAIAQVLIEKETIEKEEYDVLIKSLAIK
ncbi:MAG: ATP-dependent zinc metalloprotease FtsH [Candidatus Pacebacteria bacterium]|nr:ATP-dependent zinc metalloprotease FtsH [Candidatus Paceibacterota bacterium]